MSDILGRRVEYSTGREARDGGFIWDVGRVRAVALHENSRRWLLLIEEHNGELMNCPYDEVRLVDETRAKQLERNRKARQRKRGAR